MTLIFLNGSKKYKANRFRSPNSIIVIFFSVLAPFPLERVGGEDLKNTLSPCRYTLKLLW
jgi:hypothetical protein